MAARAASWRGQPSAILSTPRTATAVSASMRTGVAGRATPAPARPPAAGTAAPAARSRVRAQPHDLAVGVPGRRVAGHAADHEADQRPADQAGQGQDHGVARVVEDAREEVGQRLVVLAPAAARGQSDEQPADPDAEHGVEHELRRRALHQRTTSSSSAAPMLTVSASASSRVVSQKHREEDRRDRRLDHAAATAERLRQLRADDGLDRLHRSGAGGARVVARPRDGRGSCVGHGISS